MAGPAGVKPIDRAATLRAQQKPRSSVAADRRLCLWWALLGSAGLSGIASTALAGAQIEEPLADSVRGALSAAIADSAPPKPRFDSSEARIAYLRWLGEMSERLKRHRAKAIANHETRREFLETVWYESRRAGLETSLVLGLIQVESAFRKYAVSVAGARGYMQVMPFWVRLIGKRTALEQRNGADDASVLFHMQTNIRFGCVILRHYLDRERGDLFFALGRYNGSRGKPEYPNAVLAAQKRWTE